MPDGLDTVVGPGGDRLSGGQRQRVALARSRMRNTPVLILDESTSALDYYTRVSIMSAMRTWRKGKTTIVITHDLSQIDEKDYVYIMDQGKVLRQGHKHSLDIDVHGILDPSLPCSAKIDFDKNRDASLRRLNRQIHKDAYRRQSFPSRISTISQDYSVDPRSHLVLSPVPFSPLFRQLQFQPSPGLQFSVPERSPGSRNSMIEITSLRTDEDTLSLKKNDVQVADSLSATTQDSETHEYPCQSSLTKDQPYVYRHGALFKTLCSLIPALSKKDILLLFLGFVAALFHAAATPAFAFLFSRLLSTFYITERRGQMALQYSLGILAVSITNGVASFWMHYLLERCGHAWIDRLRHQAMTRIIQQPKFWFEQASNNPSSLVNCLDRSTEEMRNLVGRFAGFMFVAAVMMLMGTVWGMVLSWRLTLVGCACAPILYALTRIFEKVSGHWEGRCNHAADVVAGIFSETFLDIRTVRSLTLESFFHEKHFRANSETLMIGLKRGCYTGCLFGLSESSIIFVYGMCL